MDFSNPAPAVSHLTFAGDALTVNMASSAVGALGVELQNADGQPIDGYKLDQCVALFGNDIEKTVVWNESSDVSKLAGSPVKIRFVLEDASLYSMRFVKK